MKGFRKNGLKWMMSRVPRHRAEKIEKEAAKSIFKIKLSELRKKQNLRQADIDRFTQSSLSKLESRNDMKISTLIDCLHSIGMKLAITAYPKGRRSRGNGIALVKV